MGIFRLLAVGFGCLFSASMASANEFETSCSVVKASGNSEYPPYLWRDAEDPAQLTGAIRFLIDDLSRELNLPIELRYHGNWGRVQAKTQQGLIDMVSGAFFTKPRTEYMDYIYPKFQGTQTSVWVNEAHPFEFNVWDDLKPHQGMTVVNNSFGEEFDDYSRKYLSIEEVGSLSQGLGMLSLGRIDYLIYERNPALAYLKKSGLLGIKALPVEVTSQALYLTLSKQSPCNTKEIKDAISGLLVRYQNESRMSDYLERALLLWKQQSARVSAEH